MIELSFISFVGGIGLYCAIYLLVHFIRDAMLGAAWRNHMGTRESSYQVLNAHRDIENAQTDELMRRGIRMLSDAEVDELLKPRYGPVQPSDFQVVERGQPLRFEK